MARHLCAIALAGTFVQYGANVGINHALGGFVQSFGVQHLCQLAGSDREQIQQAVWVHLRSVPERSVSEASNIIRRAANALTYVKNDLASVSERDTVGVRKFVNSIVTDEPIPALAMMLALGRDDVRPIPSCAAATLLCHLSVVDWCEGLLHGRQGIRLAALDYLEQQPSVVMFAVEDWGFRGCPEACPQCCLVDECDALLRGLV